MFVATPIITDSHIIGLGIIFRSLVPRPHPRGGKGSGELGQNPWACAEEFPRANEIVALAQSYDKLTAGMQHRYTVCIAIQFRRPIRFKVCFTAGCGHAITCKHSHSNQSEPSFAWACQHICACVVEREPRIQPKFTRPFSSFWGWGLGTRLYFSWVEKFRNCQINHDKNSTPVRRELNFERVR